MLLQINAKVITTHHGHEIIFAEMMPTGIFEFREPHYIVYIAHIGPEIKIQKEGRTADQISKDTVKAISILKQNISAQIPPGAAGRSEGITMTEKIQIVRAHDVEDLSPDEYAVAIEAVKAFREDKARQTEAHPMSTEDAEKAKGSGKMHGDPFVVI